MNPQLPPGAGKPAQYLPRRSAITSNRSIQVANDAGELSPSSAAWDSRSHVGT